MSRPSRPTPRSRTRAAPTRRSPPSSAASASRIRCRGSRRASASISMPSTSPGRRRRCSISTTSSGSPVRSNVYVTISGLNFPKEDVWAGGLAMAVTAKLSQNFTLRSISAWRKDRSFTPIDFDATPSVDVDVPAVYRNEQTSQEFQLLYSSPKLNGLVGFYYLGAKAATGFDVLLNTTAAKFDAYTAGDVRTEPSSVFADFTYDFTPQLSLTVGGRYTWDQRKSFIYKASLLGGPLFGATSEFGGNPTLNLGASTNFRGEANFKRFTPRASLSFKPA